MRHIPFIGLHLLSSASQVRLIAHFLAHLLTRKNLAVSRDRHLARFSGRNSTSVVMTWVRRGKTVIGRQVT